MREVASETQIPQPKKAKPALHIVLDDGKEQIRIYSKIGKMSRFVWGRAGGTSPLNRHCGLDPQSSFKRVPAAEGAPSHNRHSGHPLAPSFPDAPSLSFLTRSAIQLHMRPRPRQGSPTPQPSFQTHPDTVIPAPLNRHSRVGGNPVLLLGWERCFYNFP